MTDIDAQHPSRPGAASERWLKEQVAAACGPGVRRAMLLGALASALVIPQAWLVAHAVAPVVMARAPAANALLWLALAAPLLLGRFALTCAADHAAQAAAARLKGAIRSVLLRRLAVLGPARTDGRATGDLVTTAIEGVDALEPYVARYLAHMGALSSLPLLILAAVTPLDWISGLILLATAPVIPLFMVLLGWKAEAMNRRQWRRLARLSGQLLDGLQRLATLKILNAEAREERRLARAAEDFRASTMAVLRVAFLSSLALEFFATVAIALVAVLIGFRLLDGALGFEAAFFVLLLAPEFYAPLRQLGVDYHARMEALAVAERIIALAEDPGGAAQQPPAAEPDFSHGVVIKARGLVYAFGEGPSAVDGIDLDLRPGEITVLVGTSGAGKSTLFNLLLGFLRPQHGRIMVNGHDLADIAPEHWLRQLAVVPQRPHMFAGTIADNIHLGAPNISHDELREAARLAGADDFITALPLGYDTPLGEFGQSLSGGQTQRIAIARAFLKRSARVLLLDEGAAGLDQATEAAISQAIRQLANGRTTLIIAHRLATLALADRILVMEAGRIVEQGTRADLEARNGRFAAMLRDGELAP